MPLIYNNISLFATGMLHIALCPAFPDCHSEGETYEKTINEMRSAIDAFIEDYREEGETISEDDVTIMTLRVAV